MKKRLLSILFTLCMVFCLVPTTVFAETETGVAINETNFPDANFRSFVTEQFDNNGDSYLSNEEIEAVTRIFCIYKGIVSFKGIEYFTALQELWCMHNQLTSLDVSKNTKLQKLYCSSTQLTSLDVSKNTALTELHCYFNQLTSLDISKNTALKELWCYGNQLASLNVGRGTVLEVLKCHNNNLTSLDVSGNTALTELDCYRNQLTSLNISKNTALESLYCGNNKLTSLDVRENTALKWLNCHTNQLTSLDVSKNISLELLECYNNKLTSLDVSKNTALTKFECGDNTYQIIVGKSRSFDLSTLPGDFKVDKASNWVGGAVTGSILTVDHNSNTVTYTYDCENGKTANFTLKVNKVVAAINETNFPDANFRSIVKKYDTDKDGYLSNVEIADVTSIACSEEGIVDLTGIEYFTALQELRCLENQLTSLDVSKNTELQLLNCSMNQLTSLNISGNTALKLLYCYYNQLTSLNISKNPELEILYCDENELTSLDVGKNTELQLLDCSMNQLTSLDVSKNTALEVLKCSFNKLSSLDIDKNAALYNFECEYNTYKIIVDKNRNFDLSTLPGSFDVSKASNWSGGTVSGNILTVDNDKDTVTYSYDCGRNRTVNFALKCSKASYTVAFNTNGGSTVKSQIVVYGEKAVRPDNPTKNGYIFSNWYTDEACTKSYNFDTSVTTNITLYAKWLKCNHADSTEQPTCTKSATCTICNGVIAAFGHDFSVQQHDDNSHWMKCSRCDATDGGAAHIWDDGEITVQPTCTVAGEKRYACAECGVKKTESIDAKGHNLVIHDAKAATCVEIGWEAYVTCRNCNYTTYKEIAATGNHTYEWQSKNGQYWKKCNMCNEKTAKKNIPVLTITGADKVCRKHDYKFSFTLPEGCRNPTCWSASVHLTEDNGVYSGTVSANDLLEPGTTYTLTVVAETADGFEFQTTKAVAIIDGHEGGTADCHTKAVCNVCGDSYGEFDMNNHTGEEVWEKTETKHTKKWNCCDIIITKETDHYFENGVCTVCEYVCGHKDDNKDHKCDICKKVISDHIGGKATCKDKAVCEICGKAYGELNVTNHADLKHTPAKAASKTAEGNIEYWYCDGCCKYYRDAAATKEIEKADTVIKKLPEDLRSPQTGNNSNCMLWIALLFISGGAVIGITVVSSKKRHKS